MLIEKIKEIFQIQKSPKNKLVNKVAFTGMALSVLGIADGVYLTISHYAKFPLACPTTGFINCAKVTSSSYSEVFGIPIAFFGLLFFLGMFIVQLPLFWKSTAEWFRIARMAFSGTGILAVLWLVYVEFHILHAICLYCTAVHILTFGLFVTTLIGSSLITTENLKNS